MKAEAVDLSMRRMEAQVADGSQTAVTALYRGHSLGLIRLALIMVGDRQTAEDVVLRYFCELSESEIATTMGVSRGTVKSTTSRAIAALGRILTEEER